MPDQHNPFGTVSEGFKREFWREKRLDEQRNSASRAFKLSTHRGRYKTVDGREKQISRFRVNLWPRGLMPFEFFNGCSDLLIARCLPMATQGRDSVCRPLSSVFRLPPSVFCHPSDLQMNIAKWVSPAKAVRILIRATSSQADL
jgi:hypothetical protein